MSWRSLKKPEESSIGSIKPNVKKSASKFEIGCPHFPNIFSLGASIRSKAQIGKNNIEKRIHMLVDYLVEGLEKSGIGIVHSLEREERAGIIIADVKKPEQMAEKLQKRGIIASPRGGGLRISPHYYNNESDIGKIIKALKGF